jgi:hypothetical protein
MAVGEPLHTSSWVMLIIFCPFPSPRLWRVRGLLQEGDRIRCVGLCCLKRWGTGRSLRREDDRHPRPSGALIILSTLGYLYGEV